MDTILKYLDMSFASLPNTSEIFRLKQEMAAHMEEKYNELKSEGKTEIGGEYLGWKIFS